MRKAGNRTASLRVEKVNLHFEAKMSSCFHHSEAPMHTPRCFLLFRNVIAAGLLSATAVCPADVLPWERDGLKVQHPGQVSVEFLGQVQQSPPRYQAKVSSKLFTLFDSVKGPDIHTAQLLEWAEVKPGDDVLDIGTGSGVIAVMVAPLAAHVLATDISPQAIANADYNIQQYSLTSKIRLSEGDLFKAVPANEEFDVIFLNIAYPYNEKTSHFWALHERFFREVGSFLKPNGRLYYQAGFLNNVAKVQQMVRDNNLRITAMHMKDVPQYKLEPIVYVITHNPKSGG